MCYFNPFLFSIFASLRWYREPRAPWWLSLMPPTPVLAAPTGLKIEPPKTGEDHAISKFLSVLAYLRYFFRSGFVLRTFIMLRRAQISPKSLQSSTWYTEKVNYCICLFRAETLKVSREGPRGCVPSRNWNNSKWIYLKGFMRSFPKRRW